ncbi:MAG: SWF/SNF helicase family protein [Gammaproteobacteria bacterium]|nr:SWF/SNF helicase family protein [Gammaproteobacteria bacterium]
MKIIKLLQVACGAVYTDDGAVGRLTCTHKLAELDQILIEAGTKLIIFVPFKHSITVLTEWIESKHSNHSYGVVNGDVSRNQRDEIFKSFQDGTLDVIIAHPKAMAHGLTLTAANTITWWGPIDDYEVYEQANGRITRPGQKRKQYIKHLICSPVEKAVYARLKKKESMQGILLDLIRN